MIVDPIYDLSLIHISFVASTLNIKPVMGSTDEGSIQQLGQARGMKLSLIHI